MFKLDVKRGIEEQPRKEHIEQQCLRQVGASKACSSPNTSPVKTKATVYGTARRCTAIATDLDE